MLFEEIIALSQFVCAVNYSDGHLNFWFLLLMGKAPTNYVCAVQCWIIIIEGAANCKVSARLLL